MRSGPEIGQALQDLGREVQASPKVDPEQLGAILIRTGELIEKKFAAFENRIEDLESSLRQSVRKAKFTR